jgi:hypothetical protein
MSEASAAPRLLRRLFDDASLFPPAELAMPSAVAGHARHRAAWYRDMTGPFVCPDGRLPQLQAALTAANLTLIELALIVAGGAGAIAAAVDAVAADPRLALRAVEVPAAPSAQPAAPSAQPAAPSAQPASTAAAVAEVAAALDATPLSGAAAYIEIPLPALTGEVLQVVAGHGYRVKLRTGGQTAAAFPTEKDLAAGLDALADVRLEFKCTAGLHHAVRQTAADTGFEHHGFLNLLLAVAATRSGADAAEVAALLGQRDPARVAAAVRDLTPEDAELVRGQFTSFGTCSTDEPVADLVALGLAGPPV